MKSYYNILLKMYVFHWKYLVNKQILNKTNYYTHKKMKSFLIVQQYNIKVCYLLKVFIK